MRESTSTRCTRACCSQQVRTDSDEVCSSSLRKSGNPLPLWRSCSSMCWWRTSRSGFGTTRLALKRQLGSSASRCSTWRCSGSGTTSCGSWRQTLEEAKKPKKDEEHQKDEEQKQEEKVTLDSPCSSVSLRRFARKDDESLHSDMMVNTSLGLRRILS